MAPTSSTSARAERAATFFHRISSNNPQKWLACKVALPALPPLLIGYTCLKLSPDPNKRLPYQQELQEWFLAHPIITLSILSLPILVTVFFHIAEYLAARNRENQVFERALSTSTLAAIENIVGKKSRRFAGYAKNMTEPVRRCVVFDEITQPTMQIGAIIENVHHVLHATTQDSSFQLVLARLEHNIPVEWAAVAPSNVVLPENLLREDARKTMFFDTARLGTPQIIPDIAKHLRKRKKSPKYFASGDADSGSIICFPVKQEGTTEVPFALSIKSAVPGRVDDTFRRRYTPLIEALFTRLLLEHNLETIKRKSVSCPDTQQPQAMGQQRPLLTPA